jgi:maltose alpha-D-glucosyltransferase/alpha-amylase
MQAFVPNAVDAWSYALERSRSYFAAPADRESPNAFVEDAKQLGVVTRMMHEALAGDDDDPDFAPEPVSTEDIDRWAHRTRQSVLDSLALLERQMAAPTFPRDRAPEAQALVRRRDHYLGWINEIDDQLGDDLGMRARIHGDFHLGQVLRSSDGTFLIIDFEGEPTRALSERREKTSPLRDVAGMLRSFAYAAATLSQKEGKSAPPHVRELRIARWERDVRAAYLAGYLGASDEPGLLPDEESHVRALIALFETEKVFYELAYELNQRPAWAWIPMRGIAKLFVKP